MSYSSEHLDHVEKQVRDALHVGDADTALVLGAVLDEHDQEAAARLAATSLGEAALWYAEQGIAVFPLHPRGKLPVTKHGFKDATTDIAQVREWWTSTPQANIGAPTGHMFDVIDIDGNEGVKSWAGLVVNLPPIIGHVSTPRPGGNHLYVPATGRGNKARVYPGIDYRGRGGYVVVPPSVGANEKPYRWVRHLDMSERA